MVTTEVPDPEGPAVGRPRDSSIDGKVDRAAIEQYAESGWAGFTFESVARRAQVGKPAIYRRHESREALLLSSMRRASPNMHPPDTGTLRGDLIVYARRSLAFRLSTLGVVIHRVEADQRFHPELRRSLRSDYVRPMVGAARTVLERAESRGELHGEGAAVLLLEVVDGAVHTRVSSTNPDRWAELEAGVDEYVAELVDFALRGARVGCPVEGWRS